MTICFSQMTKALQEEAGNRAPFKTHRLALFPQQGKHKAFCTTQKARLGYTEDLVVSAEKLSCALCLRRALSENKYPAAF